MNSGHGDTGAVTEQSSRKAGNSQLCVIRYQILTQLHGDCMPILIPSPGHPIYPPTSMPNRRAENRGLNWALQDIHAVSHEIAELTQCR